LTAFLIEIRKDYPKAKNIYIFLDNAKYSRNDEVVEHAEKLNIKLGSRPDKLLF